MDISNVLRTSYFSLSAKFIHLIDDCCENLDARLKQQPRITKCDAIKVTLLKALIKRVAAIALIVIACLDLLIETGLALFCKGRQARNIIGTIATICKSVACILTGQLPGVTYDLYKEGFSGALKEMIVEPLANEIIFDRYLFEARTPSSLGKCTRNLMRILKHIPVVTQGQPTRVLNNPIRELTALHSPSIIPMIQMMMKHQRGKEAFAQNIVSLRPKPNFNVAQWEELENTILGQEISNDDIWAFLEQIGLPNVEENYTQSNMNMLCSLFNKSLANRELDARIANRIVLYVTNRLVRANGFNEIDETTSRLINHPGVTPELLSQIAESREVPTAIKERIFEKYLEITISTPPENPINPLIIETTFRFWMVAPLKDNRILKIQEFYKKHQTKVVSLLHIYADSYLIDGYDRFKYRHENVRILLNMLINQFPLMEREITAIFKAAVVILDYKLVKQILDNSARRSFFNKDFMVAIDQGLQNALRREDESVLRLLRLIPNDISSFDKLQLKNLLDAFGNTAVVINWINDNYAVFDRIIAGVPLSNVREGILEICEQVDKERSEKVRKDKTPTLLSFQKLFREELVDIANQPPGYSNGMLPRVILEMIGGYYSPNATEIPRREGETKAAAFTTHSERMEEIKKNITIRMEEIKKDITIRMDEIYIRHNASFKRILASSTLLSRERVVEMSLLFNLALQKAELDEQEVQRIIQSLDELHYFDDFEGIKSCIIKLIIHPMVEERWLCDIVRSPNCFERFVYLCCSRFLEMPSLSPEAVKIVFSSCIKLTKNDPFYTLHFAKMREFYIKYLGQIAFHLHAYADEFLIEGRGSSECNRENMRTLLSTLVGFYPLSEREIKAIFKAAVVIIDYSLVEKIVECPARRAFLDKDYLLATFQAFNIGIEKATLELLDRLFTYTLTRITCDLQTDPFISRSKLKLKDYLKITKNTAPARAWLARQNHSGFIYNNDIQLAMQICDICQEIEASEQMESKQKIEGEHKQEIETKRTGENELAVFRKKFLGLVIKYGEVLPSAPVPASGDGSSDRILDIIEGYHVYTTI